MVAIVSPPRCHDDVIKWKHFPRYWPFVRGIHRSPVNSPHKGQWRGALMFSFISTGTNSWANNRDAGDLRRHRAHYGVIVMILINEHMNSINNYPQDDSCSKREVLKLPSRVKCENEEIFPWKLIPWFFQCVRQLHALLFHWMDLFGIGFNIH